MKALKEATEAFLKEVDWVESGELAVISSSLLLLAEDFDNERKPSIYAQYGLMYRYLVSLKPKEEEETEYDPLAEILTRDFAHA